MNYGLLQKKQIIDRGGFYIQGTLKKKSNDIGFTDLNNDLVSSTRHVYLVYLLNKTSSFCYLHFHDMFTCYKPISILLLQRNYVVSDVVILA